MNFLRKVETLECSSCMFARTMMSMSLAADARRLTKYFLVLLEGWRKCLPLGDAWDVNFTTWGLKVWEQMQKVRQVYSQNKVHLNLRDHGVGSTDHFSALKIWMFENKIVMGDSHGGTWGEVRTH